MIFSRVIYGQMQSVVCGLRSAYQRRAALGVDSDVFANEVITDTRNWALTAQPDQLRAVAGQFTRWISVYNTTFPPPVYTSVKWDDRVRHLAWQPQPARALPVTTLTDFRKFLTD